MTVRGAAIRHRVDPMDVPPGKAARRLHLTLMEFRKKLPELTVGKASQEDRDVINERIAHL